MDMVKKYFLSLLEEVKPSDFDLDGIRQTIDRQIANVGDIQLFILI